jgi:methylmalonyl-CoA mutase N-terminal domain/subunit
VTLQALAAVLGGAQSLHTNSKDEALSLPTADAARLALRTQQIIAYESGIANTVDPFGGSYAIEALTAEIETRALDYLAKIDSLGGMLAAVESGWVQNEIQDAAYRYQRSIESKERIVVGVNEFRVEEEGSIPIHVVEPALEHAQVRALRHSRTLRDAGAVTAALQRLESASRGADNLMPYILEAVEAYASIGEISDAFRRVHGEYQETLAV